MRQAQTMQLPLSGPLVCFFSYCFLLLYLVLTTNFFFFDCDYNDYDDDDDDYVGSRCRRGRPRRCNGHCPMSGPLVCFFFAPTLLLLVTNYDIVFRFL